MVAAVLSVDLAARVGAFGLRVAFSSGQGILALIGPSGAGKTLTLNCLAGLHRPLAGRVVLDDRVLFDGESGVDLPPRRRRIGYVFQSYALFPHLTVAQNLAFGLAGWPGEARQSRIGELLALLQLDGLAARRPRELSGGQQQRVALGRALAPKPELLLLDEPFAAVDPVTRATLTAELLALQRELDLPILLVTHDVHEAYTLGERVVVLHEGRVLQAGPREEVFRRPASATVARLVGMRNLFVGRVSAADEHGLTISTPRFSVLAPLSPQPVGATVVFGVRPEDVVFVRPGRPPNDDEVRLEGRAVAELDHGVVRTVFLRLTVQLAPAPHEHDFEVVLSNHSYRALGLAHQKVWAIGLRRALVHVFGSVQQTEQQPAIIPPDGATTQR